MSEVVVTGRADLDAIIQALSKMRDASQKAGEESKKTANKINDNLAQQSRKTEQEVRKNASLLRRVANQLYSDFKALGSLNALQGALKLSSQFQNAIGETITLSDTIRRLGGSFGIAKSEFGSFQAYVAKGLGQIGASSEEAASAMEGLTGLGVKGKESIMSLSKGAVTLAGMSGERGNAKGVAGLLGRVLQAQGKDVNDQGAQQNLIGEVTAAVQATGKQSSEILGAMEQIFSTMDKGLRAKIGPEGMAQLATIASTAGPQATKALQEYLGKSSIERQSMEAQGFNAFDKNGQLDIKKLTQFIQEGQKRIGFDPRKSLQTFGFSEEAAEGLIKIAEQGDSVTKNLQGLATATRDNEQAFRQSMGLMDSFKGTINTVKGSLEGAFSGVTQFATDLLQSQVGDTAGSTAVVASGGILAALLAGGGLRGIGGMLKGGLVGGAKKEAYEAISGEDVQSVYVVNASEIGGGLPGAAGAAGGLMGKLGSAAKGIGMVGAAGAIGYGVGSLAEPAVSGLLNEKTTKTTEEGFSGNALERLFFKLDQLVGGQASTGFNKNQQKIIVETKSPTLRANLERSRGVSN